VEPLKGEGEPLDALDRTAKLYIGGKQARPDGGYSRAVWGPKGALVGHASLANRKDVRNAVEAAGAARAWGRTTGHVRAQILYFIAENLSARAAEFAGRIDALSGRGGEVEVEASLRTLFRWAAWADKVDGRAAGAPFRGVALAMREPVGTIGVLCDDRSPLLGLVATMAPAIAMGNRTVLVASEPFPLAATDFYQVLETSDVPGGVVNILTGSHRELVPTLAAHLDLDALWSFSSQPLVQVIEAKSVGNLKRTWVESRARDWTRADDHAFIDAATEVKTVWIPYGEG
jgi:aldehyde dehydrogenase (NAD+)